MREITLDRIHDNDASLRADLEHRLGVRVVDFVPSSTTCATSRA